MTTKEGALLPAFSLNIKAEQLFKSVRCRKEKSPGEVTWRSAISCFPNNFTNTLFSGMSQIAIEFKSEDWQDKKSRVPPNHLAPCEELIS